MAHYIGTSGWSYKDWAGVLYPERLPAREQLDIYVRHFRTVEVNNTYYRWPSDEVFAAWRERLPEGFLMSVKASRGLTHFNRLKNPDDWLPTMTSGVRRLGKHLGVLLVQLPPGFGINIERL